MKTGVFGGSFNPIHRGHLIISQIIAEGLGLDRIILIPTAAAPHKSGITPVSANHRMEMCRLAVGDNCFFEVSDIEIERGGVSYTVDTLCQLKKMFPQDSFYLIMGADMFMSLESWKNYRKILNMAVICTIPRDNVDAEQLAVMKERLEGAGGQVFITDCLPFDLSSSQVRNALFRGEDVSPMVGRKVANYIKSHKLYMEN